MSGPNIASGYQWLFQIPMKLAIAKIMLEQVLNRFKYRAITDLLAILGSQTFG